MDYNKESLNDLQEIKQIMERSSRFISLSGWSGIAAGICALIGAFFGRLALKENYYSVSTSDQYDYSYFPFFLQQLFYSKLFLIAVATFIAALICAFTFTYIRSRKNNTPVWSATSRRLLINVAIPMAAGGIFILKLIENGAYGLTAPACLIFYGLALINGSKYTLSEVKYLGYAELLLGIINCWLIGPGLYFWAAGFGILHFLYGTAMLFKHERND